MEHRYQMMGSTTGTIFQIERFSTHDGPGIRTTVFLKGCPLTCWWCHNPESQIHVAELLFRENRCIKCWSCVSVCAKGAISRYGDDLLFEQSKCDCCGDCVRVCESQAREFVGRQVTAAEVIAEVEKDVAFYDESGGGVTFSGGEPFAQAAFLSALLDGCREREIRTALDTSGLAGWRTIEKVLGRVDLFLYDLKLMDEDRHIRYTGASNRLILKNLAALSAHGCTILVRVPIIPGINDDAENIDAIARFVMGLSRPPPISLLPYHRAGVHKYARLGKTYHLPETDQPIGSQIAEIGEAFKRRGVQLTGGGG